MLVALCCLIVLIVYGCLIEPRLLVRRYFKLGKKGIRIAHFSDTHFAWHSSARRFDKVVRAITEAQPDLIVFTGDLFDTVAWGKKHHRAVLAALSQLSAPLGKYAILGNHDFEKKQSPAFVQDLLVQAGFKVLVNQTQQVGDLSITGLDDAKHGTPLFDMKPEEAQFKLLMIHEPDCARDLADPSNYDLIIAGHSHGGQIRLGRLRLHNKGSKYYDKGLYQLDQQVTLVVNSGIGQTFLPIRIGVLPEICLYDC